MSGRNSISKSGVARRIRDLRKNSHYTQEFLAESLSISVSAYRKKEYAVSNISADEIVVLHHLYDVSCDYILLGDKKEKDTVWQEIVCTSDAGKLVYLMKLTEYFGGVEKVSEVFGGCSHSEVKT